jgi:hypothetical protein
MNHFIQLFKKKLGFIATTSLAILSILLSSPDIYAMDQGPLEESTFDEYFNKVSRYTVHSPDYTRYATPPLENKVVHRFFQLEDRTKTKEENEQLICQNLRNLAPSRSHLLNKIRDRDCAYLEKLFEINLGYVAADICSKIFEKKEEWPQEYQILWQIDQGQYLETDFSTFSIGFIQLAYRVANNSQNSIMANRLYPLTNVAEQAETLKKSHPMLYQDYIHEPYWSYNLQQLHDYGCRILEKLRPYFVKPHSVKKENNSIIIQDMAVREVPFGYVLPNLYLRKKLGERHTSKGVARIFLLPRQYNVTFTFKMPYVEGGDKMDRLKCDDTRDNSLQVLSKDFVVYQELIEGDGHRGNKAFMNLGHRDCDNSIQIIFDKDNKRYLIDTKEQKNFFVPFLSPYDEYQCNPALSQEHKTSDAFKAWQIESQKVVLDAKNLHFDPRVIYVPVTVLLKK